MLTITILKKGKTICGFEISSHTDPIVCSAVSALSQSTVNAIEALTSVGDSYTVKTDEDKGYLYFMIPSVYEGEKNYDADLLLRAFELSARSIEEQYSRYVKVKNKEVSTNVKN